MIALFRPLVSPEPADASVPAIDADEDRAPEPVPAEVPDPPKEAA